MVKLSRDQIYTKIKASFSEKPDSLLKEVAYNLSTIEVVEANLLEKVAKAIALLESKKSPNVLSQQITKNSNIKSCPVCKMPMKLVKLMEDRAAHYCESHRIVEPLPVED